ncbi:endonuclease/exonuclease/phosphatase family protein [Parapedobacter deserti]|uniref:Endonuclease/exonuclease/phosphatase family protein n=1 Tax=Parapedobacter deserti TaxID=1912957 RepID=A0ABV7JKY9_9SPHI
MKTIVWIIAVMLAILLGVFAAFYFWARQGSLPVDAHVSLRIDSMRVESRLAVTDSVFSVMTYNIGYLSGMTNNEAVQRDSALFQSNLRDAAALLVALAPDVVCVQEIDYGSRRSYCVDQEVALADGAYPFVARAVNWDKRYVAFPYWPPSAHFAKVVSGQSVLSRFPIVSHAVDTLATVASAPFYYRAFYLHRLAQIAKLEVLGREVMIINVHLEAFDRNTRQQHTERVLQLYRQYADRYPTIMLGDFNSSPDEADPTINTILRENLRTVDLGDVFDIPYTYNSESPSSRLDYIFYSDALELVEGRVAVEAGQISDHLPVWAAFRFANPSGQ